MMIVDKFNRKLEKYSQNLVSLRLMRTSFCHVSSQDLLIYLAGMDEHEKGFFTVEEIIQKWLN